MKKLRIENLIYFLFENYENFSNIIKLIYKDSINFIIELFNENN